MFTELAATGACCEGGNTTGAHPVLDDTLFAQRWGHILETIADAAA